MFRRFMTSCRVFLKDEDGPTLVEYSVMLMLIVLLSVTAIQLIGGFCNNSFELTEKIFSQGGGG